MAKVFTTIGIDDEVKVLWKELAEREGRSMAGYAEWFIKREHDTIHNGVVTLECIDKKMDKILSFFSENKKRSTKNDKPKEKKETAYDVWKDIGVCTKESWDQWIDHLHKLNVHPNAYEAKTRYFNELCRLGKEGWDCDQLIDYIIEHGHRKFYVPKEWIESEGWR